MSQPHYLSIANQLRQDIQLGRYLDGMRLPAERVLAANLDVAVGTVRQALDLLVADGLILRRQGSGNYVQFQPERMPVYQLFHLEMRGGGGVPSARLLALDKIDKPDWLPEIGPSAEAYRLRRIRYLDAEPVAFEEIYIDTGWQDDLQPELVPDALYAFYEQAFGLVIAQVKDSIGAAPLPEYAGDHLAPQPGTILGFAERRAFDTNGQPVEYSASWFDHNKAHYVASWVAQPSQNHVTKGKDR